MSHNASTAHGMPGAAVRQLRLVVEVADFETAVAFYRDVLGLQEQVAFSGEGEARVAILEAGRTTLELANPAQRTMIDQVEVGRDTGHRVKVAFEVDDAETTTRELVDGGAALVAPPRVTPWRSLNARLHGPGNLHITIFQELETLDERAGRAGFGRSDDPRCR